MPLSLRRTGSISTMLSGKGHRRSASDSSLGDNNNNNKADASAAAQAHRSLGAPLAPLREQASSSRPPPSAFRGARPAPPSPSPKGKERAPAHPLAPVQQRPGRAHWVIDPLESRRGAEVWGQQNRVILVLGEPSRAALAPLLSSPAFADTLLLVGSLDPIPEIELLNSPSHLLHSDTIYPTVQPFQPPASAISDAAHPVTAILQYGTALADAHRRETTGTPILPRTGSFTPRSRRGSQSSMTGSQTPPGTSPRRKRMWSIGSKTPVDGVSPPPSRNGSMLDLTRLASAVKEGGSRSRTPSVYEGKERHTLHRRVSSIFRNEAVVSDGSPFDAVVNFIPFANPQFDQQRVLQEMLQNVVVLTTATLPLLATTVTSSSVNATLPTSELAPLSLIHIVPVDAPLQLPTVIERFLLPLLPTMQGRVRRPLFGVVTGYGAWLSPSTDPSNDGSPGAETLLFGGVRCPTQIAAAEGVKPQAMLAGWDHCCSSPGLLVEMAENHQTPPTFSRHTSSMALSDLRNQTTSSRAKPSASQSMRSFALPSSPSPPSSPSIPLAPSLPPGAAAPRRSTSPTALRTTSPTNKPDAKVAAVKSPEPKSVGRLERPKNEAAVKAKSPSPPPLIREPVPRAKPSMMPRPTSDPFRTKTPTPAEHIRPESVTPTAKSSTSPSSPTEVPYISRFDPRYREMEERRATKEALKATLSSSQASSNLAGYSKNSALPKGAAPPQEFGGHERRAHGPSGLRNAVTMPRQSLQPSPPTPELDPSSSSCSSSSVLEPNWSEDRSGGSASAVSSKRSSSAPAPLPPSQSLAGSMRRKSGLSGITSIFKRRVKA